MQRCLSYSVGIRHLWGSFFFGGGRGRGSGFFLFVVCFCFCFFFLLAMESYHARFSLISGAGN